MEDVADPHKPHVKPRIAIADAIEGFLEDEKSRHLSKHTVKKSKFFFETQLKSWAARQRFVFLDQLTAAELTKFRATWSNGSQTTRRKHERMIAFFWFCVRLDWIDKNPAILLKRVKVEPTPTDYFTRDEFEKIVDATYAYGSWLGGHDYEYRRDRVRAFVLTMRWSGLAIKDTATLERTRIDRDGNLFLYRAKTGVAVYVPLPPEVLGLLRSLPSANPRYFFWSGRGDPETAKRGWTRTLARLFAIANLHNPDNTPKRCHSHMFRDTFAVQLLLAGVTIDQVSLLLGHSSVKITEKHYSPFVKARQEQLANSARSAWARPTTKPNPTQRETKLLSRPTPFSEIPGHGKSQTRLSRHVLSSNTSLPMNP